jgi:hypothetical protein
MLRSPTLTRMVVGTHYARVQRCAHGCVTCAQLRTRLHTYARDYFAPTHITRSHAITGANTHTYPHTRTCAPARSSARPHTTARRRVTHVATPYARKLAPFRAHVCKRAGEPRAHTFEHIREAYRVPGCGYVCKGADGVLNRAHTYAIVHHGCARMRVHT